MQDPADIRRWKRRSNRTVLGGLCLMALALFVSAKTMVPPSVTTVGAIAGFALLMYGVNVGWLVFYDSDTDGPPS